MDQKYNILKFLNKHLKIINRVHIQSQASIETFKNIKLRIKVASSIQIM